MKNIDNTTDKLLNELKAMVGEAEKLIAGSTADTSSADHINLCERCDAVAQKVSDVYKGAKKQTVETAKEANTFIHDNPYPSIAIAVTSGIITGLLVGHYGWYKKEPN